MTDTIESLRARLDEAEEKITFLEAGCMNLTRDELIQRITAVGPARWKAGVYWQERDDKQHAAGMQTERDHAAYLLERRSAMEAPNAAEALRFMASVIRENRTLPPIMLGQARSSSDPEKEEQ